MSFEIAPIGPGPQLAASGAARVAASPAAPDPAEEADAVSVELSGARVPDEVHTAIAAASDAYDALAAEGTQVHFAFDEATGRMTIKVQDLTGTTLGSISGSEALRLAGGEPLQL